MHLFNIVTAAAALASFAAAADNSTGSGNNVQLYINDGVNGRGSYAASIMSVCKDQTIYAIQCTSARRGGVHIGTSTCGTAAPTISFTANPSAWTVNFVTATSTLGHKAEMTIAETCSLEGTTAAHCVDTIALSMDGEKTTTSASQVVSGTGLHRYDVSITGGADKTSSPEATGECKPNAAAGTGPNIVRAVAAGLTVGLLGVLAL